MKEITILSGKGGTGKTSITAALASVASNSVFCDSDVDAADLHLILQPEILKKHTFQSSWVASINSLKCTSCGLCVSACRFNAIHESETGELFINPFQCEGCRLCERICPDQAINLYRNNNNYWYESKTRFGSFVHAKMGPGEENSGKLVTQVRKRAKELATNSQAQYLLNDGPPGIGCATISSISGTHMVVMVLEPSKTGLHDAKRLIELIDSFKIPSTAIINRFDLNPLMVSQIEKFLSEKKIKVLAKLPFDEEVLKAQIEGKTIVEYHPESQISQSISLLWLNILSQININNK